MKNYFDSFYEIIHKNSVKRRRMVSLLLVLSVFVSSGVLWELRDTVVTMVNETLCGFEEHVHTDECYENTLVCGLEENDEHTHTDECWAKVLVCGMEEHLHTTLCYSDGELAEDDGEAENEEDDIVSIDFPAEAETEEMLLSQLDEGEAEGLQFGDTLRKALANDPSELNSPQGIETIDNIARGIKFTLFDYHDEENVLESKRNNYDITWNNNRWEHNNVRYVGVNDGKTPDNDIMFFSYGTPDFTGTIRDDDDNNRNNVYTRADINSISKNNYSGDYNTNNTYPTQRSGNRPIQGIVKNQLSGGYPVMNNSAAHSLSYLFTETNNENKTVYTDVNHLLKEVNGHLVYDSNDNYAYYNKDSHDFTVYESTYHIINKDHHRAGDYNNLTDEEYSSANGGEFMIGFFPFDQYDLERRDPNYNGNGFNHHFGMTMEAEFVNLRNVSEPIVFKYSGDDDMWIFVDDVLVLDIGGIHEPDAGMIDFTNGLVWTQDNELGKTAEQAYNALRANNSSLPQYSAISPPDNGVNTDGASESKWIVETLASKYSGISGKNCDASDNKQHTIKMFYLERGGCYSNLAIDMNLPTVRPLTVTKDVDFQGHYSNDYDKTNDADSPKYQFEVYIENPAGSGSYELADLGDNVDNPFYLKDGERKDFYLVDDTRKYYVVEKNVDTNVYSKVKVNGTDTTIENGDASSGSPTVLQDKDTYNFTNVVREEKETLNVSKKWFDASGTEFAGPANQTVKFKVYRSDSGGTPKPVEINEKMTFSLKYPDWSWSSPVMLPTRYGDHIYTYTVEELNSPEGYAASYGTDSNGGLTITNRDISSVDIHVKKNWENTLTEDMKDVHFLLKRERAPYEASQPTSLKINLYDPGGNLIATHEVKTTDEDKVYAGGSVEFSFDAPKNVVLYTEDTDYPKCTPNTTDIQQIGDRTFGISNLAAVTNSSSFANVVDIKIYTDEAEDDLLLMHHSFTRGIATWKSNEGGTMMTSSLSAYAKGDGMIIKDRTASNHGARLDLDPQLFKIGHTYTFSTYVKYDENVGVQDGNRKYLIFKFTLYDGLGTEDSNYHVIEQTSVYSGEWTQLTGTLTLPEEINPYGMYLIVESFDPPGQPFAGPTVFRMDEFVAIEGNHRISVEQGTGIVTIGSGEFSSGGSNGPAVFEYNTMQNYESDGWKEFGPTNLSQKKYQSNYAVVVQDRTENWQGVSKKVSLTPGKNYHFISQVAGYHANGSGTDAHILDATVTYTDKSGKAKYLNIGTVNTTGTEWGTIDATFTFPTDADTSKDIVIYYQAENTSPFEVWNSKLYEAVEGSGDEIDGYTLSNGRYISNYSQYGATIDTDSVTNPLHLTSDYAVDPNFSREITIGAEDDWQYHWTKGSGAQDIQEQTGYRYRYYIEEKWIGSSSNQVVKNGDEIQSQDGEYLVTYLGNNVATNDADNPIVVNNRNISYRLPETGGRGKGRIYLFGSLLTSIGIISCSAIYRRRRRRV